MSFNKHVRTLATAALLALAVVSMSTGFAHAKVHTTKASCEAAGYYWSHTRGCADQTCVHNGTHYWPGEAVLMNGGRYACNGYTGEWVAVRTTQPAGPIAPAPTTNAPTWPSTPSTPWSPVTPLHVGNYWLP